VKVDELVVVRPSFKIYYGAEQKVGRLPGRERHLGLVKQLVLCGLEKLDLLLCLLLECGHNLGDRLVSLRIEALLPPDYEVGSLSAERRHDERRGENYSLVAQPHLPRCY
jgi:hypothetical protein